MSDRDASIGVIWCLFALGLAAGLGLILLGEAVLWFAPIA